MAQPSAKPYKGAHEMDWEKIDSTVREAFRKNGKEIDVHRGHTPLTDLIAKDPMPDMAAMTEFQLCEFAADHHIAIAEGLSRDEIIDAIHCALEVNWEERVRGMVGLLDYLYADGPHPLVVYRRVSAIVKAVRPKLALNMSCAQLAVLCDDGKGHSSDGRGTQSARIKRLYEEPIRKAGMHGYKAAFQKDEEAGASYSQAQRGNQNRLGTDYLQFKNGKNGHGEIAGASHVVKKDHG
jgi:hypothetical protein